MYLLSALPLFLSLRIRSLSEYCLSWKSCQDKRARDWIQGLFMSCHFSTFSEHSASRIILLKRRAPTRGRAFPVATPPVLTEFVLFRLRDLGVLFLLQDDARVDVPSIFTKGPAFQYLPHVFPTPALLSSFRSVASLSE